MDFEFALLVGWAAFALWVIWFQDRRIMELEADLRAYREKFSYQGRKE